MSIFSKIKQVLTKSSEKISSGIDNIFTKKKLDAETLEELSDLLLSSDVGLETTERILAKLKSSKFDKEITPREVKEELAKFISYELENAEQSFNLNEGLNVILVCGVNGGGKTTTIAKLADFYIKQGKKIAVAACDTFRAAAVEQIEAWTRRTGSLLIKGEEGADPASVAFKAYEESLEKNIDILFIDTAGRLHNHKNLMDELGKITRVIKKLDPAAPHQSILVIDATIGQNAYRQVELFSKEAGTTSLVITKLDGSAKAGFIIGLAKKFSIPVHFIGTGESIGDIKIFEAKEFAKALVGF